MRYIVRGRAALGLTAVLLMLGAVTGFLPTVQAADPERSQGTSRAAVVLDEGWRFERSDVAGAEAPSFDDSAWSTVTLPHTWNAADGQDGGSNYYRGPGWYRRNLAVPEWRNLAVPGSWTGRRLFLEFDGVNVVTDVFVNGIRLGQHRGGFARFRFDATAAIRPGGSNVIAVRVDNARQPDVAPQSADFTFFGGIYRPVRLLVVDPVHIDLQDHGGPGVYVTPRRVTSTEALVDIAVRVTNASDSVGIARPSLTVTDGDGVVVREADLAELTLAPGTTQEIVQQILIEQPRLWDGRRDPHLYEVSATLRDADGVGDGVTQTFGLRTASVTPSNGFSLNDRHVQLRGVSRHQDRLDKGWAVTAEDEAEDLALITDMGANALRTAHYQQSSRVYELADRFGIVVYTEVPLVGTPGDDSVPETAAFRDNVLQQMREMLRQTHNNPSVVFVGIGNELTEFFPLGSTRSHDTPFANALLEELVELIHEDGAGRISTYANVFLNRDDGPLMSHAEASGYNRYDGWYTGTKEMIGPYLDAIHLRNPDRNVGLSEYGAGSSIDHHQEAATTVPPVVGLNPFGTQPEEYQSVFHESYWKQIDARPWLWGSFVWNMFDFAVDSRNEGGVAGRNTKGLISYDRKVKKDAFFWYKANWSDEPVLHITSRRWTERTDPVTVLKVYSNARSVEVFLNEEEVQAVTVGDHIFSAPIELLAGANTIEVRALIDGVTYTDTVTWNLQ